MPAEEIKKPQFNLNKKNGVIPVFLLGHIFFPALLIYSLEELAKKTITSFTCNEKSL